MKPKTIRDVLEKLMHEGSDTCITCKPKVSQALAEIKEMLPKKKPIQNGNKVFMDNLGYNQAIDEILDLLK